MQQGIKFRYASEIAGAFVILAALLLIVGVFFAGRAQGWFEGTFTIKSNFDTEEGTFGLQEGSGVFIRQAKAGRVSEIYPTDDGLMVAVFEIKKRFSSSVRVDSVARVKRKFVAAGDAFVEITAGKGAPAQEGSIIQCVKDEELFDTAQKTLKDIQDVMLPMLDEVKAILKHVNGILASIDNSEGLAGAIINDKGMAVSVKDILENVNVLMDQSTETLAESTKLIKGAQKSWLVRKYIEQDDVPKFLYPGEVENSELPSLEKKFRTLLSRARVANIPREIVLNACNLAVVLAEQNAYDESLTLIKDARGECEAKKENATYTFALESYVQMKSGELDQSLKLIQAGIKMLDRSIDKDVRLCNYLQMAEIYIRLGNVDKATVVLDDIGSWQKRSESKYLRAWFYDISAGVDMLAGRSKAAAEKYDIKTGLLQKEGMYDMMAESLVSAGMAFDQASEPKEAADRFFRASRSFSESGRILRARDVAEKALSSAVKADDSLIVLNVKELQNKLKDLK